MTSLPTLTIWRVRPATRREKVDRLFAPTLELDAVLDSRAQVLALATRAGSVVWAVDRADHIERLLQVRASAPLAPNPDLSALPAPPRSSSSIRPESRGRLVHTRWCGFRWKRSR